MNNVCIPLLGHLWACGACRVTTTFGWRQLHGWQLRQQTQIWQSETAVFITRTACLHDLHYSSLTELHALLGKQRMFVPFFTVTELHAGSPSLQLRMHVSGYSQKNSTELHPSFPPQSNSSCIERENFMLLHFLL